MVAFLMCFTGVGTGPGRACPSVCILRDVTMAAMLDFGFSIFDKCVEDGRVKIFNTLVLKPSSSRQPHVNSRRVKTRYPTEIYMDASGYSLSLQSVESSPVGRLEWKNCGRFHLDGAVFVNDGTRGFEGFDLVECVSNLYNGVTSHFLSPDGSILACLSFAVPFDFYFGAFRRVTHSAEDTKLPVDQREFLVFPYVSC